MITIESKGKLIEIFGRNSQGQLYKRTDEFKPYFYVESKYGTFNTIDNKKVRRINVETNEQLRQEKSKYENHYEGDINLVNRYIIDRIDKINKEPVRICYLDIEIEEGEGYGEVLEANNKITIIGLYDSFTNKHHKIELKKFTDERGMLSSFIEYISLTDPDIICAWFGNGFDFPYLLSRMKKLKIDINKLSRNGLSYITDRGVKIYGRIMFDMLEAYKKHFSSGGRESWSLDYISKYELKDLGGKEVYDGKLDDLYKNNYDKFVEYNRRDVELLVLLNERLKIIDFFDEIRRLAYCRFEDVFMNSKTADCLCLKYAKRKNIILPSVNRQIEDKYEGGYVVECNPKLYENIVVMDFKCHHKDTKILTRYGIKKIEDIKEGDWIYSIDGYDKVLKIHKKQWKGEYLLKLKTERGKELIVSEEHKIPITNRRELGLNNIIDIKAKDLRKNHRIITSIYDNIETDDFSLLMGILFAEGHLHNKEIKYFDSQRKKYRISKQHHIDISMNINELDFKKETERLLIKYHGKINKWRQKGNGINIQMNNKELYNKILRWETKKEYSKEEMSSFLRGFFEGDGTIQTKHRTISLIQGVVNKYKLDKAIGFLDKLNIKYIVNPSKTNNGIMISISKRSDIIKFAKYVGFISDRKFCKLKLISNKKEYQKDLFYDIDKIVSKELIEYNDYVYDLTLENDKRPYFFANNILSHNSLYPSIMIGFNTSYETLDENGPINVDDKFKFRKEMGIIPDIVKPLLDKRDKVKKEMKELDGRTNEYKTLDMTQKALKIIANSFYGVLGFRNFRLYKREVASSITYIARKIIKEAIKWFNDKGYEVVYGDTDSIFIQFKDIDIDSIKQVNKEINEHFTKYIENFGVEKENNIFDLEFEEVFSVLFFKRKDDGTGAKKKYAGKLYWKNGIMTKEIAIVGFESRRSDLPQIGRNFLKKILEMILEKEDPDKIRKCVEDFKDDIKSGKFKPEELGIPVGINKPLNQYGNVIHIRASRLANEKHKAEIRNGDKIKFVYIKGPDNVIAFKNKMYTGYDIDYDEMIRRIVDLKVEPIFRSLNWAYKSEKEVKKDESQKTLL